MVLDNVDVDAGVDAEPPSIGETAGCGGTDDDDGAANNACGARGCGDDVTTVACLLLDQSTCWPLYKMTGGDGATMVSK